MLTVGTVLTAIALAYFTKEPHFALYTSWQFVAALVAFGLGFVSFLGAILGWPFRFRKLRFPNITIAVGQTAVLARTRVETMGEHSFARPMMPMVFAVTVTNNEAERTVNLSAVPYLLLKTKPGDPKVIEWLFRPEPVPPELAFIKAEPPLEFPLVLGPHTSQAGSLFYDIASPHPALIEPVEGRIRLVDAVSKWTAYFPPNAGIFEKGRGLETTSVPWAPFVTEPDPTAQWRQRWTPSRRRSSSKPGRP